MPCRYNLKLHGHSHSPNDSLIQMSRHIGRWQFYFNGTRSVKGLIAMSQKPMWRTTDTNWSRLLGVWLFLIKVEKEQLHRLVSPAKPIIVGAALFLSLALCARFVFPVFTGSLFKRLLYFYKFKSIAQLGKSDFIDVKTNKVINRKP